MVDVSLRIYKDYCKLDIQIVKDAITFRIYKDYCKLDIQIVKDAITSP